MSEKGAITMVCTGGVFVIGELIGGNKLVNPRIFTIIDDGKRIQMSPLPANPAFIRLGMDGFNYTIPASDKIILDLYQRVTTPQPTVEQPSVIKMQ